MLMYGWERIVEQGLLTKATPQLANAKSRPTMPSFACYKLVRRISRTTSV